MKSNPNIYPSEQFPKLDFLNKKSFLEKTITFDGLLGEVKNIRQDIIVLKGKTIEEKVFSVFLDKNMLFGPAKYLLNNKKRFIEKIGKFTEKNKPIIFTILSFPFKLEVSIKTDRTLPDMGDILQLQRLFYITQKVASVYKPGAKVIIFTEETFAPFAKANVKKSHQYAIELRNLVKKLGYSNHLKLISLSEVEKYKGFKSTLQKNIKEMSYEVTLEKGLLFEKFTKTYPVVFRIFSVNNIGKSDLYDIYTKKIQDLNEKQKSLYKLILSNAKKTTIHYLSYIKTTKDLNFLDRKVKEYLPLTVSPKSGKIGIIPISKKVRILPHHGVPVKDAKTGQWDIRYLCEVEFDSKNYEKIYLIGDKDPKPFYYLRF